MIISLTYRRGEHTRNINFSNLEEMTVWIYKYLEIYTDDFESIEICFWRGKEEERVKKINSLEGEK